MTMGTRPGVPGATPRRTPMIVLICAFASLIPAAFAGITAAATTGDNPFFTGWQSSIVCASGEHLTAEEYDVPNSTPTVSGGTGSAYTFRCAGPESTSGSRTAMVVFVQFVAGTLFSYPLFFIAAFAIVKSLRQRRRQQVPMPPYWPQAPPGRFGP